MFIVDLCRPNLKRLLCACRKELIRFWLRRFYKVNQGIVQFSPGEQIFRSVICVPIFDYYILNRTGTFWQTLKTLCSRSFSFFFVRLPSKSFVSCNSKEWFDLKQIRRDQEKPTEIAASWASDSSDSSFPWSSWRWIVLMSWHVDDILWINTMLLSFDMMRHIFPGTFMMK